MKEDKKNLKLKDSYTWEELVGKPMTYEELLEQQKRFEAFEKDEIETLEEAKQMVVR